MEAQHVGVQHLRASDCELDRLVEVERLIGGIGPRFVSAEVKDEPALTQDVDFDVGCLTGKDLLLKLREDEVLTAKRSWLSGWRPSYPYSGPVVVADDVCDRRRICPCGGSTCVRSSTLT
jgi:hypothetical protein